MHIIDKIRNTTINEHLKFDIDCGGILAFSGVSNAPRSLQIHFFDDLFGVEMDAYAFIRSLISCYNDSNSSFSFVCKLKNDSIVFDITNLVSLKIQITARRFGRNEQLIITRKVMSQLIERLKMVFNELEIK